MVIIGEATFVLLIIELCFVGVALQHPEFTVKLSQLFDALLHEDARWLEIAHAFVLYLHQCFLLVVNRLLQIHQSFLEMLNSFLVFPFLFLQFFLGVELAVLLFNRSQCEPTRVIFLMRVQWRRIPTSWRVTACFDGLGLDVDFDKGFRVHIAVAECKLILGGLGIVGILAEVEISLPQQFASVFSKDSENRLLLAELAT